MSALLAFDAAARHQSVKRAADELSLTESAVSRQISLLEELLGVRLFNRIKKRMSLTRAGAVYGAAVARSIEQIERDTLDVMAHEGVGGSLEIACLPTVGTLWLIPRLQSFYATHPDAVVSLSARSTRFLFEKTGLDGAIYFGASLWPGAKSDYLFDEELVPVGPPDLLCGQELMAPRDIVQHRTLHLMTRMDAWSSWIRAAESDSAEVMRGPRFELQSMLISAACDGQGVALLPRFLIEKQLLEGSLRVLSDISIRSEGAYYFAYPEEKAEEPSLVSFRAWLQEQSDLFRKAAGIGS